MPEFGFAAIRGHEQIKKTLSRAAAVRRPGHAYILEGNEGSGRGMLADAFAMALQCENSAAGDYSEPCGKCPACLRFLSGNHPDVRRIFHEKAAISVEDVRLQLVEDALIRPYEGPYKIYLMRDAEKMTAQAQNALLKTLEEPPEYVVIILMTANADALLPTIRSRCILLKCGPLRDDEVREALEELPSEGDGEGIPFLSPDEREMIVSFACGSIGRALKLASSEKFRAQKDLALRLAQNPREMLEGRLSEALKGFEKDEILMILDLMLLWFRDITVEKAAGEEGKAFLKFRDEEDQRRLACSCCTMAGLEKILQEIEHTRGMLDANVSPENAMEWLLIAIADNGSR